MGWREHALCRGKTDLFYKHGPLSVRKPAFDICEQCTVRTECLETAMDLGVNGVGLGKFGVWGGTTRKERQELNRKRKGLGQERVVEVLPRHT